jgi:hypothetical protein
MAWKGEYSDPGIYYSSSPDGVNWATQTKVTNVGTSKSPALCVFNGRIYLAWQGEYGDPRIFLQPILGWHPLAGAAADPRRGYEQRPRALRFEKHALHGMGGRRRRRHLV